MGYCSVSNCSNCSGKGDCSSKGITFHCFPKNPDVKEKWILATGKKKWFPTKYSRICSEHFRETDFDPTRKQRVLLKHAFPSIQVWTSVDSSSDDRSYASSTSSSTSLSSKSGKPVIDLVPDVIKIPRMQKLQRKENVIAQRSTRKQQVLLKHLYPSIQVRTSTDDITDDVLPTTTLGALANWEPPPDEVEIFRNVVKTLDHFYPQNWRSWVVNDVSYEDLFGKEISSDEENRLRFAIPTFHLALAYKTTSFSEHKYKLIKRTLIRWPLGRALIYSPFATMKRIHPTEALSGFIQNLPSLRQHLISRTEAVEIMKNQSEIPISPCSSAASASQSYARKRPHSPEPSASKLDHFMQRQNDVLEQILSLSKLTKEILTKGKESSADQKNMEESESDDNVSGSWIAPGSTPEHSQEVEETPDISEENFYDFSPSTIESEAKIGTADEALAKQDNHCQLFTSLKTNSDLATVTPNWQIIALLEKTDECLGAITDGLLQQRKNFQDIYNKASLEIKSHLSKNFLVAESPFRKTSDALLQYTCGRRAEIIQLRRSVINSQIKLIRFRNPDCQIQSRNKVEPFPVRRQAQPSTSKS